MTSEFNDLTPKELSVYGYARARDLAFDAVCGLWRRRRSEGMTQKELADRIGRDPAWVSRYLQGPGNWTLRTIGAFVEALRGEIEINIHVAEEPIRGGRNSDAYSGYGFQMRAPSAGFVTDPSYKEYTHYRSNMNMTSASVGSSVTLKQG